MANIKQDIQAVISQDRYFAEQELIRLAQSDSDYRSRVVGIAAQLRELANLSLQEQMLEAYFKEAPAQEDGEQTDAPADEQPVSEAQPTEA